MTYSGTTGSKLLSKALSSRRQRCSLSVYRFSFSLCNSKSDVEKLKLLPIEQNIVF